MQKAYLELIQLTELYLLQKLPPLKKLENPPAPRVPSLKASPVKPIAPPPPPMQPVEEPQEPVLAFNDCEEILSLIKTHCPKLKVIEKPPQEKTVFLLLDPKSSAETELVTRLTAALNKEGFVIVKNLDHASLFIAERACLLYHPQKTAIKRDARGRLSLKNSAVLVISLGELIASPERRRGLWTEILSL